MFAYNTQIIRQSKETLCEWFWNNVRPGKSDWSLTELAQLLGIVRHISESRTKIPGKLL